MKSGGHPIHGEHGVSEIVTAADDPRGAADSAGAVGAGIPLAGRAVGTIPLSDEGRLWARIARRPASGC